MAIIKPPKPLNLGPIKSFTRPSKRLTSVSNMNKMPFGFFKGSAFLALKETIIERIHRTPITHKEEKTSGAKVVSKKALKSNFLSSDNHYNTHDNNWDKIPPCHHENVKQFNIQSIV